MDDLYPSLAEDERLMLMLLSDAMIEQPAPAIPVDEFATDFELQHWHHP
jgi:hypothetical protein